MPTIGLLGHAACAAGRNSVLGDLVVIDLVESESLCAGCRWAALQKAEQIAGGLLGQWACWTKRAVEGLEAIRSIRAEGASVPAELLTLASQLTLANKAIFDADNQFTGCIPGISYVLKRQGLLDNVASLDPHERLSEGQAERIDEIVASYPHLTDDEFVAAHRDEWLRA